MAAVFFRVFRLFRGLKNLLARIRAALNTLRARLEASKHEIPRVIRFSAFGFLSDFGLRREARRHAAFVRANALIGSLKRRAGESGVAAALCHRIPKCCFAAPCFCLFCGYSFLETALWQLFSFAYFVYFAV